MGLSKEEKLKLTKKIKKYIIKKCKNDPVFYIEEVLGIRLNSWHKLMLRYNILRMNKVNLKGGNKIADRNQPTEND